ncbi:TonB-dependent receptor [Xanthomarina spongicola]|uniref:Carboxypeptidase-like protein n=1 Tax=Xanthomarina spongicola TaxID=570520 RepID=A0A316DWP5_9FLAO|nr:TonB-dependent receptor [Xanthomarina spongicola]PWK21013.1 carboxypeptidase-like protein [Xanthomarina spongicola]
MKKIIFLSFFAVANICFGQVKIEGVVKDSIGNPLELANVVAINQETKNMDAYGITNDIGKYKLSLEANSNYNIQVSYIGMKAIDELIETKTENISKDFTLQNDNTLDEVELTYEMPVTIKGDTIVYNADSFKDGTERKLEDVLKKLPGVEINDDGEIEVEGKKVSKVMVDGKDFFDGDSKLASKNIPSNAVDKVQVLKNYSEVSQLSSVTNNQDNVAINIKLKEGKENFWFGTVTAGGGATSDQGLYLVQPKLFYYSPKLSINVIGDMNNIGELAFTRRDYFNFSGGFRMPSRKSGTSINLGNNDLGFLLLQNNKAKSIVFNFGAANFSYSPKETLDISGFAIYSNSKNELQENNNIVYTDPELGIPDETTQSNTTQRSDLGMLKLSAKYKPNGNNQMDYDVLGRFSKESQEQNVFSSVLGNTDQYEESSPFSVKQSLNYYYTLDERNIFSLEIQSLIQDEDPFYNAVIEEKSNYNDVADVIGFDTTQSNYNVAQDKRVKSNQLDGKIDYWNVLNNKSNINVTLGTIYSNQKFTSSLFQFLDNGSEFNPIPTENNGLATNDINYNFTDLYLGVHYTIKLGKFTFTPGLSTHAYNVNNVQFGEKYKDNFFRVLPDFDARIQLKKSEQLIFNYAMQTQFTDVTNFARGYVMNNYNSYFYGNPELENATAHNINLTYFSFNMFNYTNVFANVNYRKSIDQIRNITNFESVIRSNTPFNSSYADESLSASGRFQRSFGKYRATVNGNFTYTKFNQFIQNTPSVNENYSQTYGLEFRTNFKKAPNVELAYRYTIQDNDQGSSRSKYFTKVPSIEFDALIWERFTFKTSYAYNNFSDQDRTINTFDFWDASLAYRKDKDAKWEFELKATNLLNTQSQTQSNTSNISVSTSEYFIQPRYLTIRAIYSL